MAALLPILQTKRLLLQGLELKHAESYQKHFCDYDVISQMAAGVPWPYPEKGVETYIRNAVLPRQGVDLWIWGLFLKSNPQELIGAIELSRKAHPSNRGFWLGRKFWGQGMMTEAVPPVTDYAFYQLGFEKLIFTNAAGNIRSRRIKEKTGGRLIEVKPAQFVSPAFKNAEIWELTREDWKKQG